MENSFLKEFKEREYYNQCTNEIELENIMGSSKIKAYIGFDCTAQSLHVDFQHASFELCSQNQYKL